MPERVFRMSVQLDVRAEPILSTIRLLEVATIVEGTPDRAVAGNSVCKFLVLEMGAKVWHET